MFAKIINNIIPPPNGEIKEGDIYKVVTTFGKTFELRYGYYDEKDRKNPLCELAVIYPDFTKAPIFTGEGEPFVTKMQDACNRYEGEEKRTDDTSCAECKYFKQGEELFGVCTNKKNKKG